MHGEQDHGTPCFSYFVDATIVITTFYLWMSQGGFDMFALVVNYIKKKWKPCHVTTTIFEVHETSRVAMAIQLKDFFTQYSLLVKVTIYVKNESTNLNTLTMTLISIVSFVFYCYHNPTLLVMMGMPCPSVISMLPMT